MLLEVSQPQGTFKCYREIHWNQVFRGFNHSVTSPGHLQAFFNTRLRSFVILKCLYWCICVFVKTDGKGVLCLWHHWIYGSRNCGRRRVWTWQGNLWFYYLCCRLFDQIKQPGLSSLYSWMRVLSSEIFSFSLLSQSHGWVLFMHSRRWTGGASACWCTSFWLADHPSPLMEMRTHTQTSPSMDSPWSSAAFFS